MVRGQLVRFGVVAAVVLGAVWAQEASGPAEEDCCHGDFRDDLDPGLGLLAEPRVVVTVRRASLSLDCAIASEPQLGNLTYTWRLRGDEIHSRSPKGRRYVHPNGTLHIRKVAHRVKGKLKMSDEGMYECYVTNSVGTVLAQRLQLFIASLGKNFTVEPRGGMVGIGESFYLPCQIQASPHDLMVVWEKDASLLKVDDNPRYIPMDGGLLIVDAQAEDSGTYQCQVTNKNFYNFVHDDMPSSPQWRNSRPATLFVTNSTRPQAAHFLLTPRNVTSVLVGDSVDLQCVPGVFHPRTISWTRTAELDPNTVLPIQTSADFTLLPWGSLRIHRASRDHVGTYTCSHTHSAVSVSSRLTVLEEPVIQDSSISRVYPLASIMRLSCLVAGQPPPSIRWLKNGEEVVPVRYRVEFLKEALVIYQGNQEDSGYYQCLVENEAGWALSLTRIAVRVEPDAPSPPYNVTGEAISSSRVRVRWEMEPSAGNLLSFTVHKRLAHGQQLHQNQNRNIYRPITSLQGNLSDGAQQETE